MQLHNSLLRALIFNEHLYDGPKKTPPSTPVAHVTSPFSATQHSPGEEDERSPAQTKSEKHKSGHHKKSGSHKVCIFVLRNNSRRISMISKTSKFVLLFPRQALLIKAPAKEALLR